MKIIIIVHVVEISVTWQEVNCTTTIMLIRRISQYSLQYGTATSISCTVDIPAVVTIPKCFGSH